MHNKPCDDAFTEESVLAVALDTETVSVDIAVDQKPKQFALRRLRNAAPPPPDWKLEQKSAFNLSLSEVLLGRFPQNHADQPEQIPRSLSMLTQNVMDINSRMRFLQMN